MVDHVIGTGTLVANLIVNTVLISVIEEKEDIGKKVVKIVDIGIIALHLVAPRLTEEVTTKSQGLKIGISRSPETTGLSKLKTFYTKLRNWQNMKVFQIKNYCETFTIVLREKRTTGGSPERINLHVGVNLRMKFVFVMGTQTATEELKHRYVSSNRGREKRLSHMLQRLRNSTSVFNDRFRRQHSLSLFGKI